MGGKPKQATRTKNNLRPSSSGRSAELLGTSVPGFVGFTTVENSGVVPIVPGFATSTEFMMSDELDPNIDDNFKILLKKLSKKDPVTKQKGLQELTELIQNSDLELVKPILPLWPRLYNQLSTDFDLRVREFTQQTHAALVNKSGKFIAPFVKQLAGPWVASLCTETDAIAKSLAAGAFQKSFSTEEKQKNLLIFCEAELLDYFVKNLTIHSQTTLLNPKNHTTEELEAKYQRVVVGSLRAFAFFLKKVPLEEQKCAEKTTSLLENAKFWSFHKSKDSGIRSAWFEVISSCLRHSPKYLETKHEAVTSIAFQNLDDSDSLVVPYVWATVVLVQATIENWFNFVSREKVFLPKLFKLLKNGGNGNAVAIYPHLLPLVSQLNPEFLGDMTEFYRNFFISIKEGMQTIAGTKSELVAVIIGYYESLKFVFIQLAKDENHQFAQELMDDHVIAVIYWGINAEQSYVPKQLFSHVASLIAYWNEKSDFYGKILNRFWSETFLVLKSTLESHKNIEKITAAHLELVLALRNCNGTSRQKANVKFAGPADEVDAVSVDHGVSQTSTFDADLRLLIQKLCAVYVENAESSRNSVYVLKLERLIKDFPSATTFEALAGDKNLLFVFDTFKNWLLDENLRSESVVELILMLMKQVQSEEKSEILEKIAKIQVSEVQSWVLLRLLSHPLCQEPCVGPILELPEVQKHLISCAKAVVANDTLDNLNLLHKCFFQNESGEILINVATCEAIVDTINEAFDSTDKSSLDTCASFIAQIMPVICSDEKKLALQHRTFMKLFAFSVKSVVCDDLSEDTLWEVTTAWQDSLSSDDIKLTNDLLEQCASIVEAQITEETEPEGFERVAELCSKLINCSTEDLHEEEKISAVTNTFKALLKPNETDFKANLLKFVELSVYLEALNASILREDLTFPLIKSLQTENCPKLLSEMTKQAMFKACLLFKLTCSTKKRRNTTSMCDAGSDDAMDVDQDDDEELTEDYVNIDEGLLKDWSDGLYEEAMDVIKAATVGDVLVKYGFSKYHEDNLIYLSEKTSSLLEKIPDKLQHHIKSLVFSEVQAKAGFASRTLLLLQNLSAEFSDPENASIIILEDVTENFKRDQSLDIYSSVLQALTPVLQPSGLPIIPNLFENHENLYAKVVAERMLIENHFGGKSNEMQDKKIIGNGLIILHEILMKQKQSGFLLYNTDISQVEVAKVAVVVQIIHLIKEIVKNFAPELDGTRWDFVRLALSSWVLSVSKSAGKIENEAVTIFVSAVFELFGELIKFFTAEKTKSSTELLSRVIVEWEDVFAKENNLVLLKSFMAIVKANKNFLLKTEFFARLMTPIATIDIRSVIETGKLDNKTSLTDFLDFLIDNLDDQCHAIRICCANLLRTMTPELISIDLALLQKRNDSFEAAKEDDDTPTTWHVLHKFLSKIEILGAGVEAFIADFSFKVDEEDSEETCPETVPYLLVWQTILYVCSKAPAELRSVYTHWISRNHFETTLLPFVFKLLPREVLKNPDSSMVLGTSVFAPLTWEAVANDRLSHKRYGAHIYTQCLRYIPAIVRKWWNGSNPRQSSLVDKITTNFVSNQLCQDEFASLIQRKDKNENMTIKVAATSRQVTAVYSIDEAKLELIITLPVNYPLGAVKVESGKAIGGRLQSRQIVMQCTIFLTHQNGSIFDGLTLWKKNLDRKFEGVEECYICYAVIHQDTCQLPKLTCKTCKKKFHGPCLYKWFHTSNKSTCPICRNIF
ncbi:E3 ubiquitin-protein ligase listerin [Culicoides brevitarsis]|uniref:E3 ubiquitin-protein ligase listerin n=1 Tax=Culicoides brevitarsis TaxID=469753 RepID=UPI00307C46BC